MKLNGKKILLYILSLLFVGVGTYGVVNAATGGGINSYTANMYTTPGDAATNGIGINTIGTDADRGGGLIQVIKNFINWVLGILSLIALALCLWGGFQIVTAAGDEGKQKKGISVLKHAAIGLVVIGLSWFIVTIIFRLLRGVTGAETT